MAGFYHNIYVLALYILIKLDNGHINILWNNYLQSASLLWRHNGRNGVSNHQPDDCFLNCFIRRSKKISKLRVTGLCAAEFNSEREFSLHDCFVFNRVTQMTSNGKNVSIWWRHHVFGASWRNRPDIKVVHGNIKALCGYLHLTLARREQFHITHKYLYVYYCHNDKPVPIS